MSTETLLLLLVLVLVVGALPSWPYSRSWGYAPTGVLTLMLVVFIVWAIAGERPLFRSSGQNLKTAVQDAGQDIKAAGRDVADSIKDATN